MTRPAAERHSGGMDAPQRCLGILGGMAWPSTAAVYRALNEQVHTALGGVHSADLVIRSLDFAAVEALQAAGDWDGAGRMLGVAAGGLRAAGADAVMIATNTMHRVADDVTRVSGLPVLHIADATAAAVRDEGVRRVGLLGTSYTMEGEFFRGRLTAHGLDVVVPEAADRAELHRIIYAELVNDRILPDSREAVVAMVARLVERGAEGVIAGCTEIELLVGADDVAVAWFPTAALHVGAAGRWLLGEAFPAPPDGS